MFTISLAILMLVMYGFFADERAANRAAHEICPDTHVERAEEGYGFGCNGRRYAVRCADGECVVEAR